MATASGGDPWHTGVARVVRWREGAWRGDFMARGAVKDS